MPGRGFGPGFGPGGGPGGGFDGGFEGGPGRHRGGGFWRRGPGMPPPPRRRGCCLSGCLMPFVFLGGLIALLIGILL